VLLESIAYRPKSLRGHQWMGTKLAPRTRCNCGNCELVILNFTSDFLRNSCGNYPRKNMQFSIFLDIIFVIINFYLCNCLMPLSSETHVNTPWP
jgi:hypothetical protein